MRVALTILVCCLAAFSTRARSVVTVTIDPDDGPVIPDNFVGLSFETSNLLPDKNGRHFFSGDNARLIETFRSLGIRSLRLGGGTAEIPKYAVPGPADIDALFAFAERANVKVIYTLRLLHGDPAQAARIAHYIMSRHGRLMDSFELGNEPDWISYRKADKRVRDYSSYIKTWRKFAKAVLAVAPEARFDGPATGSNFPDPGAKDTSYHGKTWTLNFAEDERRAPYLSCITQHDYPGGEASRAGDPATARERMLSQTWDDGYQILYDGFARPSRADGLRYRLEEASNFSGGVPDASDTYAAALWALDFMHWWAAHGAAGVNFHNRRWIPNVVIYPSGDSYAVHPIGFGLKMFELGGRGAVKPLSIVNGDHLNLTAYAVRMGNAICLTVINKEHGADGREAVVTVAGRGIAEPQGVARFRQESNDVAAKSGVRMGTSEGLGGRAEVVVPPASVAIITIPELNS